MAGLIFYDDCGLITRMEYLYLLHNLDGWLAIAVMYGWHILMVEIPVFDKVLFHHRDYKIVNGKLKYNVSYPVL